MRRIVNSGMLGRECGIILPGWDGEGEKTKIHYLDTEEGIPLLLVHPPGLCLYTFRSLIPFLEGSYRCVAPDLPGFGFSGRPVSFGYSVEEMGACLLSFMDAAGLEKAHVFGGASGSLYALSAAKKAPERFLKLLLCCPGGVEKQAPYKLRRLAAPVLGPLFRELYTKKDWRDTLCTAYFDSTVCTEEVAAEFFKTADSYTSRQAFMYAVRNMDSEQAFRNADRLQNEIFILWGSEDRWLPIENMDRARDAMPLAYRYKIDHAGHFFWEEKARETADMADKFFRYQPEEEKEC